MVSNKLVRWIKKQKTKGYSDTQIKNYLIGLGYSQTDVDGALLSQSDQNIFSLFDFVEKISFPLFFVFIMSFLFVGYSFNEFFTSVVLMLILVGFAFLEGVFYGIKLLFIARLLIWINLFLFLIYLSVHLDSQFVFYIFLFVMLHSFVYFLKSKRRYSFEAIFLSFFISITISLAFTIVLYLVYAYLLVPLFWALSPIGLILIFFPLYFVFAVSYIFVSVLILNKLNFFNYRAYFKLNISPSSSSSSSFDKKEVVNSIKWVAFIFSVLIFIALFVFIVNMGIHSVNSIERKSLVVFHSVNNVNESVCTHFSLNNSVLSDTLISRELEKNCTRLVSYRLAYPEIPETDYAKFIFFNSGRIFDLMERMIVVAINETSRAGYMETSKYAILKEYPWIHKNEVNGTLFYDGTSNLSEHEIKLRKSVRKLYSMYIKPKHYPPSNQIPIGIFNLDMDSLLFKVSQNIRKYSLFYKKRKEFLKNESDFATALRKSFIIQNYEELNVNESRLSKVLRLKILQVELNQSIW